MLLNDLLNLSSEFTSKRNSAFSLGTIQSFMSVSLRKLQPIVHSMQLTCGQCQDIELFLRTSKDSIHIPHISNSCANKNSVKQDSILTMDSSIFFINFFYFFPCVWTAFCAFSAFNFGNQQHRVKQSWWTQTPQYTASYISLQTIKRIFYSFTRHCCGCVLAVTSRIRWNRAKTEQRRRLQHQVIVDAD